MNPTYTQLATGFLWWSSLLLMMTVVLYNLKRLFIDIAPKVESRQYQSAIEILHATMRLNIILSPFIVIALVFAISL